MTDEQLIEQIARAICCPSHEEFCPEREIALEDSVIPECICCQYVEEARALLPFIHAARAEGRVEGIEAAAQEAEHWFPADTRASYKSGGVVAAIRALDPVKIVKGIE